jgi:hypothetical protein
MVNKKTTEKQRKISEAKCWLFGKKKKKKPTTKLIDLYLNRPRKQVQRLKERESEAGLHCQALLIITC